MALLTPEENQKINDEVVCETIREFRKHHSAKKLSKELSLIAYNDPSDFFSIAEGGELQFRTFKEIGSKRRAIESIEEKTVITESKDGEKLYKTSTVKVKFWSKLTAINTVLETMGMKKPAQVDLRVKPLVTLNEEDPA